ncbi:MAG: DUF58 domain-containing protein [Cycloclasticus sp.]|jgi:Uncharacterized conserved protein (some members contain a von Willebrand factor type A (vWA) domain)
MMFKPQVRLTATGWSFLLLVASLLLMALHFNNNGLFAMCFLLAGLLLPVYWQNRKNIKSIASQQWRFDRVFAGETLEYSIELRELAGVQHEEITVEADIKADSIVISLNAVESKDLFIRLAKCKRGRISASPVSLVSDYPLGIFRAMISLSALPECVVYPAAVGQQPLPQSDHNESAHIKDEADTLSAIRRYRDGDKVTRIAWKASARSADLMSNEYDGAEELTAISLDWQQLDCEDDEGRLSQLCAWVLAADRLGLEYSLKLPNINYSVGTGIAHREKCLRALALSFLPIE